MSKDRERSLASSEDQLDRPGQRRFAAIADFIFMSLSETFCRCLGYRAFNPWHRVLRRQPVATATLGRVHRVVGMTQQGLLLLAMFRVQGDADAGADLHGVSFQLVGLQQHGADLLGDGKRVSVVRNAVQHHHELIATQPRHHVRLADAATYALADFAQQQVAQVVAVAVVDALEAVQVEVQHGQPKVFALRGRQRLFQSFVEAVAVGQVGQRVVGDQVFQAGPVALAFDGRGDLCRDKLQQLLVLRAVARRAVVALHHQGADHPVGHAQRNAQPVHRIVANHPLQVRGQGGLQVRRDQQGLAAADHFVAQHGLSMGMGPGGGSYSSTK